MSGQLVGEVIAASAELRKRGLSRRGYEALIGIAEKCHSTTRQGSVRRAWIRDSIYGAVSLRAADRAIHELKRLKLIAVIRRGYKTPKGQAVAPIYEMAELSTLMGVESNGPEVSTPMGVESTAGGAFDTSANAFDTSAIAFDTYPPLTCGDVTIDVSIDGSIDGGRARAGEPTAQPPSPSPPATPPKNPSQKPAAPTGAASQEDNEPPKRPRPRLGRMVGGFAQSASIDRAGEPPPADREQAERLHEELGRYRARIEAIPACPECDEHGYRGATQCWHGAEPPP